MLVENNKYRGGLCNVFEMKYMGTKIKLELHSVARSLHSYRSVLLNVSFVSFVLILLYLLNKILDDAYHTKIQKWESI